METGSSTEQDAEVERLKKELSNLHGRVAGLVLDNIQLEQRWRTKTDEVNDLRLWVAKLRGAHVALKDILDTNVLPKPTILQRRRWVHTRRWLTVRRTRPVKRFV